MLGETNQTQNRELHVLKPIQAGAACTALNAKRFENAI